MMGNAIDFGGRPIHFIGIGGIGMSGLAYVLARRGLPVSGSDLRSTNITQKLEAEGAHVFLTQDASNLEYFHNHPSGLRHKLFVRRRLARRMGNWQRL
jgi:UDP-N-acetylmuramate--alanine ligase